MKKGTINAIHACVAKYRKYAGMEDPAKIADLRLNEDNCDLCRLYFILHRSESCLGCPVRERTGESYCNGTPYREALRCQGEVEQDHAWHDKTEDPAAAATRVRKFNDACGLEADFLESLLPEVPEAGKEKPNE